MSISGKVPATTVDIEIYRSQKNKWIRGVCGGIREKFGVDPLWIRLGFVAAALIVPGVSLLTRILLYVLLGILLPKSPRLQAREEIIPCSNAKERLPGFRFGKAGTRPDRG